MTTDSKPAINRPLPAISVCPFCGSEGQRETVSKRVYYRALVRCPNCEAQTCEWTGDCQSDADHRAVGAWNSRAADPRTKALVEALGQIAATSERSVAEHFRDIARTALAQAKG